MTGLSSYPFHVHMKIELIIISLRFLSLLSAPTTTILDGSIEPVSLLVAGMRQVVIVELVRCKTPKVRVVWQLPRKGTRVRSFYGG